METWINEHTAVDPPALLLTTRSNITRHRWHAKFAGALTAPDGARLNRDLLASQHGSAAP